jgi:hypothetical protein
LFKFIKTLIKRDKISLMVKRHLVAMLIRVQISDFIFVNKNNLSFNLIKLVHLSAFLLSWGYSLGIAALRVRPPTLSLLAEQSALPVSESECKARHPAEGRCGTTSRWNRAQPWCGIFCSALRSRRMDAKQQPLF